MPLCAGRSAACDASIVSTTRWLVIVSTSGASTNRLPSVGGDDDAVEDVLAGVVEDLADGPQLLPVGGENGRSARQDLVADLVLLVAHALLMMAAHERRARHRGRGARGRPAGARSRRPRGAARPRWRTSAATATRSCARRPGRSSSSTTRLRAEIERMGLLMHDSIGIGLAATAGRRRAPPVRLPRRARQPGPGAHQPGDRVVEPRRGVHGGGLPEPARRPRRGRAADPRPRPRPGRLRRARSSSRRAASRRA